MSHDRVRPDWIRPEDQCPATGVRVLVVDGYGWVRIARRSDEGLEWGPWVDDEYEPIGAVKLWHPLPEVRL